MTIIIVAIYIIIHYMYMISYRFPDLSLFISNQVSSTLLAQPSSDKQERFCCCVV